MHPKFRFYSLLIVSILVTVAGLQLAARQGIPTLAASPIQNMNIAGVAAAPLSGPLAYVIAGGYVAMFLGMVIEGPMVTAAASFAASLGYFNIFFVLILAILGDLTGDAAYYTIGYVSRVAFVEKYGHRFGMSKARMQKLERLLRTHPGKTLLVIKVTGLATPGLMMVGATRMPIKKFASVCLTIIIPKVLLFVCLGYYFGRAYTSVSQYVQNGEYFIILAVVATLCVYYIYTKAASMVGQRLETI